MLILLFTNCRKEDVNETVRFNKTETVDRFFKLPATVDCEIKALANNLKKQDSIFNFLPKFVAKNGYPVWDKVKYDVQGGNSDIKYYSVNNEGPNDKGIFLLPFVDEKTNQVKSYLVAKKYGLDKYAYQLYNRDDLSKVKVSKGLETTLIQTQAVFGFFEKTINNKSEIELTNPKKTKIKDIDIKLGNKSDENKKVISSNKTNETRCAEIYYVDIKYIDYTDGTQVEERTYTLLISYCYDDGGSGNSTIGNPWEGGMPNNPNNPWGNGNWWDYGAGYPNPFDPDGSLRYFYYNYEYDPYGLPFVPWFLGGGGVTNQLSIARQFIINNLDLNSSERNYIQNIASENKINILAEIFAEDDNFIENKIIAEAFAEFLTNENQSNLNLGAPKLLELQQYTQDVISEGVVSVAKYLRKVYLAAKKYCDQNPSHLVLYNSFIIEPIRTGANNVTNKNSETFSWGDLFSIWIFELGNYSYRSLPKYALSGNVPTISILQDADVITGNNINDPSINAFKNLSSVKNLRTDVKNNLKLGTLNVNGIIEEPFTFDTNEYYGSLATQNIAKIFLGSFQTKAVIISKNSNSAVVKFYVENLSGWESATRFIKAEGGNSSIIDNKPRGSGINLGGNLGQIYEWTESITW